MSNTFKCIYDYLCTIIISLFISISLISSLRNVVVVVVIPTVLVYYTYYDVRGPGRNRS